jgi:hypothetical protein
MGAIGTFKLGAQFPDLFARAESTVGDESASEVLPSLRNLPILMWNNHGDELVNEGEFVQTANDLDALGYRYELDAFRPCANAACSPLFPNHLQLAINDWYKPAAEFLGTARVERNPAHVTYTLYPDRNHAELKLVGDHAYWVSGLKLRDGASSGTIDAVSRALGIGDPEPSATQSGTGMLEGGNLGSLLYTSQKITWGPAPRGPRTDAIDVSATGIESATIDPKRAGADCKAEVKVASSDGPLAVTLTGCNRTVTSG